MSATGPFTLPRSAASHLRRGWRTAMAGLLIGAGSAAHAATGPMDFVLLGQPRPARVAGQTAQVSWRMAEYSALRLVEAEAGSAANEQPQILLTERLQAALASITTGGGTEALFARDEVELLAATLQKVLGAAQPGQDVLLMSSARRGHGLLAPQLTVTARLFVHDGQLHLLVHDDRLDAVGPYRQTTMMPTLAFGSRSRPGSTQLRANGRAGPRNDWLSWPLATLQTVPATGQLELTTAAPAASPPSADTGTRSAEERLRLLKRLHEQGLITDDDYTQRRRQILAEL